MKVTTTLYKAGSTLPDGCTTIDAEAMKQMVEAFNNNLQDIRKSGASHYGLCGDHITHKIERVYIEGDSIKVDLEIIDTPQGRDIKKLWESNAAHPSLEWIKNRDGKIDIKTISIIPNSCSL